MIAIPNIGIDSWLEVLKPYQQQSLQQLISQHGEEKAAQIWLTAKGVSSTKHFGGIDTNDNEFWDRFKAEFKSFICGDDKYDSQRAQLVSQAPIAHAVFLSIVSGALASTLGFAASLLAPAIVIMLNLVSKMGVNSYCKCD